MDGQKTTRNGLVKAKENNAGIPAVFGQASLTHVPDYSTCTAEMRQVLDERMATLDPDNPDTAANYRTESLTRMSDVVQNAVRTMQNENGGAFRKPAQELLDSIRNSDIGVISEAAQDLADNLIRNGGKIVKHNKGMLALTATAMLTGQFWAAAIPGGVIGVKEYMRRQREKTILYNSPEMIEERLRSALSETEKKIREVNTALARAPRVLAGYADVDNACADAFRQSTLDLAAGREALRRTREEDIPSLQKKYEADPSFENERELRKRMDFARTLDKRLTVIEIGRAGLIRAMGAIADGRETVIDASESLHSVMGQEVPMWQLSVWAAGNGLDVYHVAKTTEDFRDHQERMQDDADKMIILAREAALSGRIDNPERIRKIEVRMAAMERSIIEWNAREETFNERSREALKSLESTAARLMETRVKIIQEAYELEGPRTAKKAIGHSPAGPADGSVSKGPA